MSQDQVDVLNPGLKNLKADHTIYGIFKILEKAGLIRQKSRCHVDPDHRLYLLKVIIFSLLLLVIIDTIITHEEIRL